MYYNKNIREYNCTYVNGYPRGEKTWYYESGKIEEKGNIGKHIREGLWVYHNDDY